MNITPLSAVGTFGQVFLPHVITSNAHPKNCTAISGRPISSPSVTPRMIQALETKGQDHPQNK